MISNVTLTSAYAGKSLGKVMPTVGIKSTIPQLNADECVSRIQPGNMSAVRHMVFHGHHPEEGTKNAFEKFADLNKEQEIQQLTTGYYYNQPDSPIKLSGVNYSEGSLNSFLMQASKVDPSYINFAVGKKEVTQRVTITNKKTKESRVENAEVKALISVTQDPNAESSILNIDSLDFSIDEVHGTFMLGAALVATPVIITANAAIERWNKVIDDARSSRNFEANTKAAQLNEMKIQKALEVYSKAQSINLLAYACEGDQAAVQKQVTAFATYLNSASSVLEQLIKEEPKSKRRRN